MVNLAEYYKYQISKEGLEVSQEYNAMDWTRFFFGKFNQLYRWLDRGSVQVKVEGLEVYIQYLTGNATSFGRIVNLAADMVDTFTMPFIAGIPNIIKYWNTSSGNAKGIDILKQVPNVYYLLYNDTKKINWQAPEHYKDLLDLNKKMIGQLNTTLQLPDWRKAYTNELNQLKLLRPKEIENDIRNLETEFNVNKGKIDPKAVKAWETIIKEANELARSIVDFLMKNIRDNNNYIK